MAGTRIGNRSGEGESDEAGLDAHGLVRRRLVTFVVRLVVRTLALDGLVRRRP